MKIAANLTLISPSKDHSPLLDKVGIQESMVEDVAKFELDENGIKFTFNTGKEEYLPLRSNDGQEALDWRGISLYITRKFLEIDMSK